MNKEIRFLDSEFVEGNLGAAECISLMEKTLKQIETGECVPFLRTALKLPNQNILGIMPGYFEEGYFGAKILSVYPFNSREGYPSHQGGIVLFEKEHGQVLAIVDAMSVTGIRTGAVSAAASSCLANPASEHMALLGCGEQAKSHLNAMMCRFALKRVTVWSRTEKRAREFVSWCAQNVSGMPEVKVCSSAKEAVRDADIICTLTPSKTPILEYDWIKPGAHINAVGACSPDARELDSQTVVHSRFFGDSWDSVSHESGDFLFPLNEGLISEKHFLGTIGQVLNGSVEGRKSRDDITVFKSLGLAVEDVAAAEYLYRIANKR